MATDPPSCFTFNGSLYRDACPNKPSELDQCPWLCTTFLFLGPPFLCSQTNISSPNPIEFGPSTSCQKCSPAYNSMRPIFSLPPASTTFQDSTMDKATYSLLTSYKTLSPYDLDKTKSHAPTAMSCTSAKPFGTDTPAIQAIENGTPYSYRFSCGTSVATVAECPYLCNRGPSNHTLQLCSPKDISDPNTDPVVTRLVCEHCLLPGETTDAGPNSSSSASPSATCISTNPTGTSCPLVKHNSTSPSNGPLLQSRCGTTSAEVAGCPFLCTTVDPVNVELFHCVNEDLSGKNPIFDEYHIASCAKCLPSCP